MAPTRAQGVALGEHALGLALRRRSALAQIRVDAFALFFCFAVPSPERSARRECVVDEARLSEASGQPAFVSAHIRGLGRRGVCGKFEPVVGRDPGTIPARVGGEQLGFGRVEAIRERDDPDPEANGITLGEARDRRQGELAVGIVDLMEELDLVRRTAKAADELAARGVETPEAREHEHQEALDLALPVRAVLAARGAGQGRGRGR